MIGRLTIILKAFVLGVIVLFQEIFTFLRITRIAAVFYKLHSKISQSTDSEKLAHLGFLYERVRDLEKAKEFYEKALILEPQRGMYYAELASIYEKQNNMEFAIENYEKFLQIDKECSMDFRDMIKARVNKLRTLGEKTAQKKE
jgi:tetratricopeptide (TPR) repeat protein